MIDKILEDWTDEHSRLMERGTLLARHRFHTSGLFDEDNLVRILNRHPREDLYVYTMGHDRTVFDWRRGDAGDLPGDVIMEILKRGRIYFNVVRIANHHDEFTGLIDKIYDELQDLCPGFHAFNRSGNLIISSPNCINFYHSDAPLNMLWHIRGLKRVWVYPMDRKEFITQEDREMVFAPGEVGEEVPFDPRFDEDADVYDLEPGQMITWPQNTPHSIQNIEDISVSLSTEHYTPDARRRQAVFLANWYFRKRLPFPFKSQALYGPVPFAKANVFRVLRRLGMTPTDESNLPKTFVVDPEAPDGVRDLAMA